MTTLPIDPVLSRSQSLAFEKEFFKGDEEREWQVMNQAGEAIAESMRFDLGDFRSPERGGRLLILVGKGHNGGDAVIAAKSLLLGNPALRATLWPLSPETESRPHLQRALQEARRAVGDRMDELSPAGECGDGDGLAETLRAALGKDGFLATVDGLLGMQAKLPLRSPLREWVALLNEEPKLGVRFAVDLPTGLTGDSVESGQILRADFTYCAGIVKSPVLRPDQAERVGRLRYLDLGFFESSFVLEEESSDQVLRSSALEVLRRERPTLSDKRSFGHLLLLAGSRDYAGAAMMAAQAALKAGVGLLTVGIPESLHAAFAAQRPEAMWIPLPETPEGGLALEGLGKVRSLLGRINALAAGPGIGSDPESHALIRETLGHFSGPAALDADALRPELLAEVPSPERLVLTPHAGEFERMATGRSPESYAEETRSTLALKGPHTRVYAQEQCVHCLGGNASLARGGSGDLLTGIIGGLLAKQPSDPWAAALLGVTWHARAGEILNLLQGQESVFATELLDYLSCALDNDF